ncbi:MAG TPA: fumarylacetoacetate hydrolase family protein [Steroidobacteraceae bacterium]|jgi:fumarylpyruvate hydrolase|nr:fumarylacetoacetate hydrolase family protein [Steroidobacteraceae bacterium]
MTEFVFPPPALPSVAVAGSVQRFPVHRIYCVGLNYAAHIKETGADPTAPPVFFMKPADAVVADGAAIPYPPGTANFHYEIELVVALGSGGSDVAPAEARGHVFGYAAGNDLTRRDLQSAARKRGQPWDTSKGFDFSAPVGAIRPASHGHPERGRIWLKVNGETRQDADISDLVWDVPQIIAALSRLYTLQAGDLIFTGTPSGVGPLRPGDRLEGGIEGLAELRNTISAAEPG